MTVKTVEQLIAQIKGEIICDIQSGRVPVTVSNFGDLHDHVDANCYGDLCDDETADKLIAHFGGRTPEEGMPDMMLDYINAAFNSVSVWLTERGHHEALKGQYEVRDSPDQAYDLLGIEGQLVVITQQGGGFVMKPPADHFFKHCRPRTERPSWRLMLTGLDGIESAFLAWSNNQRWNGWAQPMFEKAQLLEVITLLNGLMPAGASDLARFNEELDVAEYYDESEEQWFRCAPEEIEVDLGNGGTAVKKLYPLGDGWCWNFYGWWSNLK